MPIDGASLPCSSLPLGSPSHARTTCSNPLPLARAKNFPIFALQNAVAPPCKPAFCMHSANLPDHRPIIQDCVSPGSPRRSLSSRADLQNDFFEPISSEKHRPCVQKLTGKDFYQEGESLDLESGILEFMENSERPDLFPTRSELLQAGRCDLVEAILARGGWMVAGWDVERSGEAEVIKQDGSSFANAVGEAIARVEYKEVQNRLDYLNAAELPIDSTICSSTGSHCLTIASDQASQSAYAKALLERQKGWEKVAGLFGLSSTTKPERGDKSTSLGTLDNPLKHPNVNGTVQSATHLHSVDIFGRTPRDAGHQLPVGGSQQVSEIIPAKVKKRRRQKGGGSGRAHLPANGATNSTKEKASRIDRWVPQMKAPYTKSDEQQQDEITDIAHRIHCLEAELASNLDSVKSGRLGLNYNIKSSQRHNTGPAEIEDVSDALEFCETEILNKRRELRTARAQRTAFEGKLALDLMEFKKSLEEKDKQLEQAMQVMKMLRTARIVWANPASEVFLAGSYDGWTSWRRMEKSSAGVFVTALQLYPGQYEIKFIVDGEWRADPNRPVTWANSYENNVLTIL